MSSKVSTLDRVKHAVGLGDLMHIYVQYSHVKSVKPWHFMISKKGNIADLKIQIEKEYEIPVEEQELFVDNQKDELAKETELLSFANKKLNFKLARFDDQVILNVKYKTGDPVPVRVQLEEALKMVRFKLFDKSVKLLIKHAENQFLELSGDETMKTLNLKDGDTIYVDKEQAVADIPPTMQAQLDALLAVGNDIPDKSHDPKFQAENTGGDKSSLGAAGRDPNHRRSRSQEAHKGGGREKRTSDTQHDYEQFRRLLDDLQDELKVTSDSALLNKVKAQNLKVGQSIAVNLENERNKELIKKMETEISSLKKNGTNGAQEIRDDAFRKDVKTLLSMTTESDTLIKDTITQLKAIQDHVDATLDVQPPDTVETVLKECDLFFQFYRNYFVRPDYTVREILRNSANLLQNYTKFQGGMKTLLKLPPTALLSDIYDAVKLLAEGNGSDTVSLTGSRTSGVTVASLESEVKTLKGKLIRHEEYLNELRRAFGITNETPALITQSIKLLQKRSGEWDEYIHHLYTLHAVTLPTQPIKDNETISNYYQAPFTKITEIEKTASSMKTWITDMAGLVNVDPNVQGRVTKIKEEVQKLLTKSKTDDESIRDLQTQLRQETATLAARGGEIATLQREIVTLKQVPNMDDNASKLEVQRLLQVVKDKSDDISRIQRKHDGLQHQLQELNKRNQELEERMRKNDHVESSAVNSRARQRARESHWGEDQYDTHENAHRFERDGDAPEDNISMLHTEHLLTRIQNLLGPKRDHDEFVDELVYFLTSHIKGSKERHVLMQKMMPGFSRDSYISDDVFGKWLLDYLLSNADNVQSRLQQLQSLHHDN